MFESYPPRRTGLFFVIWFLMLYGCQLSAISFQQSAVSYQVRYY
jgi:hypothetical protein